MAEDKLYLVDVPERVVGIAGKGHRQDAAKQRAEHRWILFADLLQVGRTVESCERIQNSLLQLDLGLAAARLPATNLLVALLKGCPILCH